MNKQMQLNRMGEMVKTMWCELPRRFSDIRLDGYAVMPNHVHGIVVIVKGVGAPFMAPVGMVAPADITPNGVSPVEHGAITRMSAINTGVMNHAPTLGQIVRTFKALSTRLIHSAGMASFQWQRDFYERVIRNDEELNNTRQYIQDNPANWEKDPENVSV